MRKPRKDKGISSRVRLTAQKYGEHMGVSARVVQIAGGVDRLQKLSPEVQRILLGKSK